MCNKPHILIFPYPAQGHMLPLLDLTHQLALRSFTITILITPKNLPTLNPILSTHPTTIHTLILPFPSHPKVPRGIENVKDLGASGNVHVMSALSKLREPIVQWFQSHPSPPVAIISDFFLGWTLQLSHYLGIPRIAFYSSGAFLTAVSNFCWKTREPLRGRGVVECSEIPGTPSFKEEHLPSIFRCYEESDPDWEIVKEGYLTNLLSWGCVFNTFRALEGPYLEYLREKLKLSRVFAIGPLSLRGPDPYPNGNPGHGVFKWLDGCPHGSVLYICFGSQKLLKREQMEALAGGLERSDTRFIWVVKVGTAQQTKEGYGVVPDGFEGRVSGRGLVIKGWVPQVAILGHCAVGGFLSHCGWNSVLEAMVAGVMVLGWPMEADQFVNARLLVEDKGVAVRVCEGADSVPNPDELGRVIQKSMTMDNPKKERAKKMRDEALKSVSEVGESSKELDELVEERKRSLAITPLKSQPSQVPTRYPIFSHYSSHPFFHLQPLLSLLHRAITPLKSASPCCSLLHCAPPPCWSSVVFISLLDLLSAFDSVLATSRTERNEMHKHVKDVAEGMRAK
ncbi:UDP-glycosyltransferase 89A2-like [Senna tora]|uniref:UDP-glycosyltransferase 89A2-like n=1 Tax=Senna tora TaxID=362788 RepID=A0A834W9K7_9FABA|nr:UDP-glycosyltransferase 89A2-like [Senna tora]